MVSVIFGIEVSAFKITRVFLNYRMRAAMKFKLERPSKREKMNKKEIFDLVTLYFLTLLEISKGV